MLATLVIVAAVAAQFALATRLLDLDILDQSQLPQLLTVGAVIGAPAAILLCAVAWHLHFLTRERRRNAIVEMLVEALAVPANPEDAGRAVLVTLTESGVATAGVVAVLSTDAADESTRREGASDALAPVATVGGRRGWSPDAAPGSELPTAAATRRESVTDDPWLLGLESTIGRRPWVARIPVEHGDEVLGVLLLAGRRRGWLRDRALLHTAGTLLAAAFDHGRQYQVAFEHTRDLEAENARRREFLYAIAHELRSPLTSIQAFAELLTTDRGLLDGNSDLLLASLSRGVDRLATFVNDLLDLGRAEASGLNVTTSVIDVTEALRGAETILRPAFMSREQALTIDIPDSPLRAVADSRALEQVMLNLLSNANRFTPTQGAVGMRALLIEQRVRIEVHDSGPGIDQADRERIFEPFYRVHRAGAHEVPGSGLGLAVARRLTELQGGKLWVEAGDAGGSRFCIELPAAEEPATAR